MNIAKEINSFIIKGLRNYLKGDEVGGLSGEVWHLHRNGSIHHMKAQAHTDLSANLLKNEKAFKWWLHLK